MAKRGPKGGTSSIAAKAAGLRADEVAALKKVVGSPITPERERELSIEEQILLLEERLYVLDNPPPANIYQADFYAFATECCWTADEARGGRVALMPQYPFLREMADALITCPLLFIEKSRRVLASWLCCCFDIWVAAGGQDPRWAELMLGTGNRQVFIIGQKFESTAWFLKRRIKFICDQFEERGGRELWPEFPTWEWKEGEGEASNGSLVTAVGQGSDQVRGAGATALHVEEVAFLEKAQATIEGALPVVNGGGHVYMVSTPNAASYAKKLRDGQLKNQGWR